MGLGTGRDYVGTWTTSADRAQQPLINISPILQDPLPWQQKVRFAKGIASGMVSLGTNLASELAGEAGGGSWERCKVAGRHWKAARVGWAANAELLSEPVKLTPDDCYQLTTLLSKDPNLQGQTGHGQGELETQTSTKWPGLAGSEASRF